MMRSALNLLGAAALGAGIGFAIQWPVALLAMRIHGAGYTNTVPSWDPAFATFDALWHGTPLGLILASASYLLFFSSYAITTLVRFVPLLTCITFAGAVPGIWFRPLELFTVVPAFFAGCTLVAYRLSRNAAI